MTEKMQNWLLERYNVLYQAYKRKRFKRDDAFNTFKEEYGNSISTDVILSKLRKLGLLEIHLDYMDARKRFYNLKTIAQAKKDLKKQEAEEKIGNK